MATANITWVPFPGPNNQNQTIQYKKYSATAWTTFQTVSATTTSATISGLDDNVSYEFRIITNCFVGGPTPGALQGGIKQICPNATVTSPSITSVNVSVFYAANDMSNITISLDAVGSLLPTDHQTASYSLSAGHGSGTYSHIFNSLQPATAYDITITYNYINPDVDPLVCVYEQITGDPPVCTVITLTNVVATQTPPTTIPPAGCQCYEITIPFGEGIDPVVYIPCGGGAPVSIDHGTNKYCVGSIVSIGGGTLTPIAGSTCTSDNDCRPCRCYQITYNHIMTQLIDYIDCNGVVVNNRLITQDTRLCAQEHSITFDTPANLTVVDVDDCTNCEIFPVATGGPFNINWHTTVNNPCDATPWTISPSNLTVRYDVSDSLNCGGTCDSIQSGTAVATIQTGPTDLNLTITVTGLAELQIAGYERLPIIIDGIEVQTYMAAGGLLGCAMGAPTSVTYVPGPYTFLAGSAHTVEIDFSTLDANYHTGAYYEVTLNFT